MPDSAPSRPPVRRTLSLEDYRDGIRRGDRAILGRAITLVESSRQDHQYLAQELLSAILPDTGNSHRIGITGVPGAGKSTFIESFGGMLTGKGHRVAVLAIDPTSSVTGGSILGDKTRMVELAADPRAFIRPSPSAGTLGGVTRKTRETMLLCEAAGFDVILVETVGVGQSETVVYDMVDFFFVLMIAGAGDQLQGIKRGVLELADMLAVNKADGDNQLKARQAALEYRRAFHLMRPLSPHWTPPVVTCSGLKRQGLEEIWELIREHRRKLTAAGEFEGRRRRQRIQWMWDMVNDQLGIALRRHPSVQSRLPAIEQAVLHGTLSPTLAARHLLEAFGLSR
ncbi:MAG TPA: methylmalonyl Co-A mutase-associated GTPase MeaB [Candidatus Sumerlaeota bacterium]|nr:methylmalonyl Co-A mutase-associated GTPase MeaB [Candidatus Sumerlaeota bacterium]